jgi:hypothetical protein
MSRTVRNTAEIYAAIFDAALTGSPAGALGAGEGERKQPGLTRRGRLTCQAGLHSPQAHPVFRPSLARAGHPGLTADQFDDLLDR